MSRAASPSPRARAAPIAGFFFLNLGHFLDHYFVLIFATVAALQLPGEWSISYAELIPYATPGLVLFGLGSLPAGWLADKWSREGMLTLFFVGIGAASIATSKVTNPLELMAALAALGAFASIYHPVGIPLVVELRERSGVLLALNGVFGNLGVACAALVTGFLIELHGWRSAFWWPGLVSIGIGVAYAAFQLAEGHTRRSARRIAAARDGAALERGVLLRMFGIVLFTTAIGGFLFQSTTFALPKVLDERLPSIAGAASEVGLGAFAVLGVAAFGQLAFGHWADRHSLRTLFAAVTCAQALFLGLLAFAWGEGLTLLWASAAMLFIFSQIPLNDVLTGRLAHSAWRSRAFAARSMVTFTVSASALPAIAWIHARGGFGSLFAGLAIAALFSLAAVLALPARHRVVATSLAAAAEGG